MRVIPLVCVTTKVGCCCILGADEILFGRIDEVS